MANRETSRRALLAGTAAGAVVVAVDGVRAAPARAADGDAVILGRTNETVDTTVILAKETALWGTSHTDDGALVGVNTAPDGYGVRATAAFIGVDAIGDKYGVYASSGHGTAVRGESFDGIALSAHAGAPQATALQVDGAAEFSRSGIAIVPAGQKEVTVTGVRLTAASIVLATMQQYRSGSGVALRAAIPDSASSSFRLRLTDRSPEDTKVGWFIVN